MRSTETAVRGAEVALRTFAGFSADRCSIAAAGITYFALISIFPLALVALSVAGFIYSSEADQEKLLDTVMERLPLDEEGGRGDLAEVITSIVDARGTLGVFGILSALFTGSALFTAVRVALNGVFGGEKARPFVVGKAIDIGMVIVFGGLLVLSSVASFGVAFIGRLAEELGGDSFGGIAQAGMGIASVATGLMLSVALFLLLYTRIPARAVPWKHAVPGAVLAALLFEALKAGFAQYAAHFGNYNATYGSLGFVLVLLAFIYFTSQVTLLGAEAARATAEVATGWPLPAPESRLHAVGSTLAKARPVARKLLRRPEAAELESRRNSIERMAEEGGSADSVAAGVEGPASLGAPQARSSSSAARDARAGGGTASSVAAIMVLAGLFAAAFARARRKR